MADNLFLGLPPPSATPPHPVTEQPPPAIKTKSSPAPAPVLKSVLKRDKPSEPQAQAGTSVPKRLRFKTTMDASETQVIEAMQKIASHIKNPTKFGKASKLALQLIQAGSIKQGTSDSFFAILEAAMSSPLTCTEPSLRADYQALFSAAQDVTDCFSKPQKNQLASWTIRAVVANDLYTDDSFVFSKAAGRIKEAISSLPVANEEDDTEEAAVLAKDKNEAVDDDRDTGNMLSEASPQPEKNEESDPFGLDALLPKTLKKDEKGRGKKEAASLSRKSEEDSKRFVKSQREALILCLEIAARRYKIPWAQTVIDILVQHAFDNIERFTSHQRDAIGKLWTSIREQHTRRKQGKSVTGKLDMNAFEWLQLKYANEKISIRHAVGDGGKRRAEQWLG
ncbi:nucleolar/coiled-body phosphoprotein isoform X2 [Tasmannia lanceolata]|uniref:nucleolar/coiled-body phosphoprotein isoform X2 n=1 Tax=Tasmannia lanceolata TaxID=3420 RepID=UPI004062A7BD